MTDPAGMQEYTVIVYRTITEKHVVNVCATSEEYAEMIASHMVTESDRFLVDSYFDSWKDEHEVRKVQED